LIAQAQPERARSQGIIMKNQIIALFAASMSVAFAGTANAQLNTLFNVNFNAPTYTDGAIVGQDGWVQTGTTMTAPILVSNTATNGFASIVVTGQDVQRPFDGAASVTSGSVFFDADITVSAATATGDYALHFANGTTTDFYGRTYFRQSAGGFQMALATSSGAVTTYGTDLNLGQTYRVLVRYDMIAGPANDTGALFINPTTVDGSGDTPYINALNTGTDAVTIAGLALRQGTNSATLNVDNYRAFTVVPEPASMTLLGFAVVGIAARRWREKK
jgi:hypothetical protein